MNKSKEVLSEHLISAANELHTEQRDGLVTFLIHHVTPILNENIDFKNKKLWRVGNIRGFCGSFRSYYVYAYDKNDVMKKIVEDEDVISYLIHDLGEEFLAGPQTGVFMNRYCIREFEYSFEMEIIQNLPPRQFFDEIGRYPFKIETLKKYSNELVGFFNAVANYKAGYTFNFTIEEISILK